MAANAVTPNVTPDLDKDGQNMGLIGDSVPEMRERATRGKERSLSAIDAGGQGMARKRNGAGHGVRTRDIQLGKLALYQLS